MKLRDDVKVVQITKEYCDKHLNNPDGLLKIEYIYQTTKETRIQLSHGQDTSHVELDDYIIHTKNVCWHFTQKEFHEIFEPDVAKSDLIAKNPCPYGINLIQTIFEHTPDVAFIHTDCDGVLKRHEGEIEKLTEELESLCKSHHRLKYFH